MSFKFVESYRRPAKVTSIGIVHDQMQRACRKGNRTFTLYEEGDYGPEVNIEFTDGTAFNICLRTEPFIEAKHLQSGDGERRVLHDHCCPIGMR